MANIKSAQKRVRQQERRAARNQALKSRVKTLRTKALAAATAGNKEEAEATMTELSSAVDKAVKKSVFHKSKGANLKSKTSKALKAGA